MYIFNTLSKNKEEFKPISENEVKIYTCGPTVYDHAHIGHWFNYVRMDTLIRTLIANGYKPNWVMNITDVGHLTSDSDEGEDKLEKGARREGKTAWQVAEFYTNEFLKDMTILNISTPTKIVRATDHIKDQIDLIKRLDERGYTYTIDDGVYFDTSKYPTYGDFAQLDIDEQQAGARVNFNQQKKNISDFALWKFSPADSKRDMEWESPWGIGFPGWHIECSAMSMKYLGETLDIHTGGLDHIPVHHTNEIAQSEAATGQRFSNYWLHSNHVMVDGDKISKSLGNGIKLSEVLDKGFTPDIFRINVLESLYKNQSQFSWATLESSKNRYEDLAAFASLKFQPKATGIEVDFEEVKTKLLELISDDLNTPKLLAYLSGFIDPYLNSSINTSSLIEFNKLLVFIDSLLGLKISKIEDISKEAKKLIEDRYFARKESDWETSDAIRDSLTEQGIGVSDTPNGTIWRRIY